MRIIIAITVIVAALGAWMTAPASSEAANCEFVLGFKALRDMIPDKVGDCLVNEYHNPLNGDGLQDTTSWHGKGGLMVWRKADNWTAYTDGSTTWLNGPRGLQSRPNSGPLFDWERPSADTPTSARPTPEPTPGVNIAWTKFEDGAKTFKYPAGWTYRTRQAVVSEGGALHQYLYSPDEKAWLYFLAPFNVGVGFKTEDFIIWNTKAWAGRGNYINGAREFTTINGYPAVIQWYEFTGASPQRGVGMAVQQGQFVHYISGNAVTASFPGYEAILLDSIRSFTPKR